MSAAKNERQPEERRIAAQAADEVEAASGKALTIVGTGTGVVVLFLVLRLMAVAHWDWDTAGKVLDAFDFTESAGIAFGTFFAEPVLAGWILAVATPFVIVRLIWHHHRQQFSLSGSTLAVLCVVLLLSVGFSSGEWWTVVCGGVILCGLVIVWRLKRARGLRKGVHWVVQRSMALVVLGLLLLGSVVDAPWSSHEAIRLSDGTVHHGYVLKESPSGMHVLTDERDVVIVMGRDVVSREYS